MNTFRFVFACVSLVAVVAAGCGGNAAGEDAGPAASSDAGLTAEQLEKGIGPVTSVSVGPIDPALVARGEEVFTMKCAACHKQDERYVGPAMAGVTQRRAPEYIMNMMLNPEEMVRSHPEAKALLAEFMTPMPNQQLSEDDARAVLEYLRSADSSTASVQ